MKGEMNTNLKFEIRRLSPALLPRIQLLMEVRGACNG